MNRRIKSYLRYLIVVLMLALPACKCSYKRFSYYRPIAWQTPFGMNCPDASTGFRLKVQVTADPEASAVFIGFADGVILLIFVDPVAQRAFAFGTGPVAVMSGPATRNKDGSFHIELSGTNPAAGFSGTEKLSGDLQKIGASSIALNGTLNIRPSVDQIGTTYSIVGTAIHSYSPAPCFYHGFSDDPVSLSTGEYISQPVPDLDLGGPLPVIFRRYYGSYLKPNGGTSALGDNWMHNYDVRLGLYDGGATVLHFGGGSVEFTKSGTTYTPTRTQVVPFQLIAAAANYQFLDPVQGLIYTFSSVGALIKVEDRNGNAVTVTQGANGPTQVSDGLGRTITFTYNAANKLTSITDQSGRTVSFGYTTNNLTTVTNAAGKITTYGYTTSAGLTAMMSSVKRPLANTTLTQTFDSMARVARQTDALGGATTFSYSVSTPGTLVTTNAVSSQTQTTHADLKNENTITDAAGKIGSATYDASNRPTQFTDRIGGKSSVSYDANGGYPISFTAADGATSGVTVIAQSQGGFTHYVITKQTLPDGTSSTVLYDLNGNPTTITNPAGASTVFTYNNRGQVVTRKDPTGNTTTFAYNSDATVASSKNANGDTTTYAYDTLKRIIKITRPDNTAETFAYDSMDHVVSHAVGTANPDTATYDDNGNLKLVSTGGASTTFTYDAADRPLTSTVNNVSRSVTYDALGRVKSQTNEVGERLNVTFDNLSRQATLTDGNGAGYKFTYNAQGFPLTVTDATGGVTAYTTDPVGRILTETSPLNQKSTYTYDKLGRRVTAVNPLGQTTRITYGTNGVSRVDLPLSITTSYARNAQSQITSATDPNGNAWVQAYDAQGRRTGFSDPLGRATTVRFDSQNRVTSATNGLGTVNILYNPQGGVTQQMFTDGTALNYTYTNRRLTGADNLTLAYGPEGHISSSNGITNTRDAVGRLLTITYAPDKVVSYKYNNLGLATEVKDWLGGVTTLTYDAAQRLLTINRPNGAKTTYTRDAEGRITSISEALPGAAYSIALTLNAQGNVVAADRTLPTAPSPAAGVSSFTYDAADQVAGSAHDVMGRLTSDGVRTYKWDLASRLASYTGADGSAQFVYDGLGLRTARTSGGVTETYVWNYAHLLPSLAVVRIGSADQRYNIFLPEGIWLYSIKASNNARSFAHFDEEASTTFLTDDKGAVTDSYGISAFGESVTHLGASDNPFTFHGALGVMQEGNTGLFYMRARYYNSSTARFISRDPLPALDPFEINPYQFALNNPIGYRDPTGAAVAEPQIYIEDLIAAFLGFDSCGYHHGSRKFLFGRSGPLREPIVYTLSGGRGRDDSHGYGDEGGGYRSSPAFMNGFGSFGLVEDRLRVDSILNWNPSPVTWEFGGSAPHVSENGKINYNLLRLQRRVDYSIRYSQGFAE